MRHNEDRGRRPAAGAPSTASAQSSRKNVTVRVSVTPPATQEGEELKEEGYGHGV